MIVSTQEWEFSDASGPLFIFSRKVGNLDYYETFPKCFKHCIYRSKETCLGAKSSLRRPVCKPGARGSVECMLAFPLWSVGVLSYMSYFLCAWVCVSPSAAQAYVVPGRQ